MTVKPGHDPIDHSRYEPLLLTTKEQFDRYWPHTKKLVDRCLRRATYGEFNVEDVYQLALSQRAFVFIVKNDEGIQPDVKLAVVVEVVNYPHLSALNILALAGSKLDVFYEKFWNKFCGWAYMNGARAIEGLVTPAMRRVISKYGFKQTYIHMRLDLTEA